MRVLIVTGEFPPMQGGVGDYTRELATALATRGVDVHVLAPATIADAQPTTQQIYAVHATLRTGFALWTSVAQEIQRLKPDVILIQYQTAAYNLHPAVNLLPLFLYARFGWRCPRIATTFHDLKFPYIFPKAGPLRIAAVRLLARTSDLAIATNVEDAELLQKRHPAKKIVFIPIGSNIANAPPTNFDRAAQCARWGVLPTDWLLCYFGFLNPTKGGEILISTLDALIKRGAPAHLLMIGGHIGSSDPTNAAYFERVKAKINQLGLENRVHWTGFVSASEVTANFLASDVCVLPYADGAGRSRGSLMAALAHGLPVITTRPARALPGLADGENVVFVNPNEPETTAEAIAMLMQQPERRAQLARAAREINDRYYTWDAIAAQHLAAFDAEWEAHA